MRWDHQGVLKYQGKPVAGSNVIDLVNDVIRQRKRSKPKGWEQFAKGLRDINQEVVGNRQPAMDLHAETRRGRGRGRLGRC